MAEFQPGDIVVLKSGSMRMLVESVEGESVGLIWANDGGIGRDSVPAFTLKAWEDRPREYGDRSGGDRPGGGRGFGGPHKGGGKPFAPRGDKPFPAKGGPGGPGGAGGPGGPRPKTGMDGKPKQKNFYRKDD